MHSKSAECSERTAKRAGYRLRVRGMIAHSYVHSYAKSGDRYTVARDLFSKGATVVYQDTWSSDRQWVEIDRIYPQDLAERDHTMTTPATTITRITLEQSIGDLFNSMDQTQLDGVDLHESVRRFLSEVATRVRDAFPDVEVVTDASFHDRDTEETQRIRIEQTPEPDTASEAFAPWWQEYEEAMATVRELESSLWEDGERWIVYATDEQGA